MTNVTLDATELVHLALHASQQGNSEAALMYLKRAIQEYDAPHAHYLLGAEYAQLGMMDRAAEAMQAAVEREPSLYIAHFQLGLLHLTSGNPAQAEQSWAALDVLGEQHALYQFKTGLLHMVQDQFSDALHWLRQGLASNQDNPALNQDMQRVIDEILKQTQPDDTPPADSPTAGSEAQDHVLISAYRSPLN